MGRERRTGIYDIPLLPELEDLFRVQFRGAALKLRTNTIGVVKSYDPTTQRAVVIVQVLQVFKDVKTEPTQANPNPIKVGDPIELDSIPVAWPRTSSGYLTFPLKAGDSGELRCLDRNPARWYQLGIPVDPVDAKTHNLGFAVFAPNIFPSTDPIVPSTAQDAAVLEADLIKLGRNAAQFVALSDKVDAALSQIRTWANSHVHTGVETGVGSTGSTASPLGPLDPTGATKVQAE